VRTVREGTVAAAYKTWPVEIYRTLTEILPSAARRQFYLLALVTTFSGTVELLGVGLVIPFIAFAARVSPFGVSSKLTAHLSEFLWSLGVAPQFQTLVVGAIFVAGIMTANLCLCACQYLAARILYGQKAQLGTRVAQAISTKSMGWFERQNSAELSMSLMGDVANTIDYIGAAQQICSIFIRASVVYLFFVTAQPRLALLTALLMGGGYLGVLTLVHRPLTRAGTRAHRQLNLMYRASNELVGGARELKVAGRAHTVVDEFAAAAQLTIRPQIWLVMPGFVTRGLLEVISVASVVLLLAYFNYKDGNLANGLPILSAYALAGIRLIPSIQQALNLSVQMGYYKPALARISLLLNEPPEHEEEGRALIPFEHTINLRDVSFGYGPDLDLVLKNVNLSIEKRQRVALVGETGCGKSTLIDLLLALRYPTAGQVEIDGVALQTHNCLGWRERVGYVPQAIYMVDGTLAENVAFGLPPEQIDAEKLRKACRAACLHDFIETLPQGYETQVGERGVRLSGGQCQRVGIARALYHEPEVVIFDEATSALDNVTEGYVLEALEGLKGAKTLVVVAHRLNTVWDFDQIFVLDKGCVVGQGTSSQLLQGNCPTFERLALRQNLINPVVV
jgi:ABC-type multidrug transport system fused ATPase/permease subunit